MPAPSTSPKHSSAATADSHWRSGPQEQEDSHTRDASTCLDALLRQRNQQESDRLTLGPAYSSAWQGLVFLSQAGIPLHPSNVRRTFHNVCQRAGLPRFTPYEMRPSAASLLIAAGVQPFEVADILGHVDLRMLERHYRHRVDSVVTGAVAVMDALAGPEKFGSHFGSQTSAENLGDQTTGR